MASWTDWLEPGNGPGMACMCPLGQILPRGQSYAHIIIGLAIPTRSTVNLIMSCLRASQGFGPWCSFGWGHILCLLSKAGLLGPASLAIFAGATFAAPRLLAMSFITFLTALALMPSGLSIPVCFRMLKAPCVCSCGIRTKRLLAIASQPFCKWPTHEHRSVLISQEGSKESLQHPWKPTRLNGWNSVCSLLHRKEGRKESLQHPWQPTRLNGWNSVCLFIAAQAVQHKLHQPN